MHFLKDRQSRMLAGLTVLFIVVIAGFLIWGFDVIITNFDTAFGSPPVPGGGIQFKIDDARKILETRAPILQ